MYYVCPACGKVYYSAADPEHLANPYCRCGARLEAAGEDIDFDFTSDTTEPEEE